MSIVHLLLGGNIGDREYYLHAAIEMIQDRLGRVIRKSSIYETEPWGFDAPLPFLNLVVLIKTSLTPIETLTVTQTIETSLGRKKQNVEGYESREIDIDILLFDDLILGESNLHIPHPRMHLRKFTMLPLSEISGKTKHPVLKTDMHTLNKNCSDKAEVKLYKGIS